MKVNRQDMERVRLRFSMKQLDHRLKVGSTGYTNPKLWVKESPIEGKVPAQFVWVAFDNGAHERILWGVLQRLDGKTGEWVDG
tara:strand:- start:533 stop:781 length:249 start_codon:yes stop_codon:yes gene_type:complete